MELYESSLDAKKLYEGSLDAKKLYESSLDAKKLYESIGHTSRSLLAKPPFMSE